ncbi:MAG TPA: BTAD domain-containing putative transcriptional regulator [Pyrinomonadaceae bacterium]|jgi:ATP/maltotriose-dependent transcriptional regulator MalT/DNA-binding SARP family transcriptional activator
MMLNDPHKRHQDEATSSPPAPNAGASKETSVFFLRTKLLPPRPAPALLPRPRLMERLRQNLSHPVTLVTANAGSGKTTLVADFVRNLEPQRFVWYQLDQADADPLVFLGYLAHGIRQAVPGFGAVTLSYLEEARGDLAKRPERALDVLLNEVLDSVEQQLVLVLDDYHHLGAETAVHEVVDRLLHYLPDVLHLIIISRELPPLALVRMRTQSSLTIVARDELLFTDEETQQLFRQVFDLELRPEQLAEYRARTEGWITALQLVRQVAQRSTLAHDPAASPATQDLTEILRQSERDIFDYFAEEVFADEAGEAQKFLLGISLLERVEPRACRELFPEVNAVTLLQTLARRNVFVTLASDGRGEEYRLHPLFRDFLRRRVADERGRHELAAEHGRLADYFLRDKSWERALHHLIAAEDFERAAQVIASRGGDWIETGAFASLVAFIEQLPAETSEAHPRVLLHQAEVARLYDDQANAGALFRRAAALLHESGDTAGEAEALHSLAALSRRRGEVAGALDYVARAEAITGARSVVRARCANTRGLCLSAEGRWKEAEREFRAALSLAEEIGDEPLARIIAHNLGTPAGMRGDFVEAMRWLRRLIRDGQALPVPQETNAHLNIARCHFYRGEFDSCEQHLERAMQGCQTFNLISLRGEVYESYGNLYRERGDAAHAAEYYERAARAYDVAGIKLARRELPEERALLALQLGDAAAARATMDRLIAEREDSNDEVGARTAALTRGRILLAQGEHEAARNDLAPALAYFREHNLYYYETQATAALAACALASGHTGEAGEHLRRALDLAARYDYDYWLEREVSNNSALFIKTGVAELLPPDVREKLTAAPTIAAASPAQPAAAVPGPVSILVSAPAPVDLTINLLGAVEVYRDPARPFAPDAWKTKRSRDLLCFVASRRHRRTSKDAILDAFWPDAELTTAEKNFYPTMSLVRKALNSNQPVRQNFLVYRDGEYLLDPAFTYRIDLEEFDQLVAQGEAALRSRDQEAVTDAFERAVALSRGDFMQGSYDDWVEEQRSYYREQYVRLLETLAKAALKAEDWSRSLHYAQRILRDDSFREDVHAMLMRAHAALGNRVAVREQYEELRRLLREELGVEPTAETQRVYREMMK